MHEGDETSGNRGKKPQVPSQPCLLIRDIEEKSLKSANVAWERLSPIRGDQNWGKKKLGSCCGLAPPRPREDDALIRSLRRKRGGTKTQGDPTLVKGKWILPFLIGLASLFGEEPGEGRGKTPQKGGKRNFSWARYPAKTPIVTRNAGGRVGHYQGIQCFLVG